MAANSELAELRHRFSRSVTCQERTGKPIHRQVAATIREFRGHGYGVSDSAAASWLRAVIPSLG
jgi:hypothetical protein